MENILVVDDDPSIASQLARVLDREGFKPILAGSGRAALACANDDRPELILLDLMLPDCDGMELCKMFRENPATSHVPIIMITAKTQSVDKVEGLMVGADDYVAKPFDENELVARIKTHLRRYAVERAVNPLTQLPGNLDIDRCIDNLIAGDRRFSVLYVDLDDFKAYNDHYGFTKGDEVILLLASTLRAVVKDEGRSGTDLVGHIGGDDFVVITEPVVAKRYCERIIAGFDSSIGGFYDKKDYVRGYITSKDRRGTTRSFPMLSVSIAVVSNEHRQLANRLEVGEIAAQLKRVAKGVSHSSYHLDKRKAPA